MRLSLLHVGDIANANIPAWDDQSPPPLRPLDGDVDADVCVIGIAGSGLACIHELLRLDQRGVAAPVQEELKRYRVSR